MRRRATRRSLDAALRDIRSDKREVRIASANDLTHYAQKPHGEESQQERRPEIIEALVATLSDHDHEVRAGAASALGEIGAVEAIDQLAEAATEDHPFVRQMALSALADLDDMAALPFLEEALTSSTPSDRFQAVIAFVRTCKEAKRVHQVLLKATRDDDHLVRHIALRMAEERGDDDAPVEPVFVERAKAMLDDDSDIVRVAAAVILGRMGRKDGMEILCDVASRDVVTSERDDEAAAVELCGLLNLKRAHPALMKRAFGRVLILTRDPFVWHARVALAAMRHPKAVKWILDDLDGWTLEKRTLAVAAAGRAKLLEAQGLIAAMLGKPDRAVQDAVSETLAALDKAATESA